MSNAISHVNIGKTTVSLRNWISISLSSSTKLIEGAFLAARLPPSHVHSVKHVIAKHYSHRIIRQNKQSIRPISLHVFRSLFPLQCLSFYILLPLPLFFFQFAPISWQGRRWGGGIWYWFPGIAAFSFIIQAYRPFTVPTYPSLTSGQYYLHPTRVEEILSQEISTRKLHIHQVLTWFHWLMMATIGCSHFFVIEDLMELATILPAYGSIQRCSIIKDNR